MTYNLRWYLCDLTEQATSAPEPDWSRVPEAKREAVRQRWQASNLREITSRVWLWGPQIPFFSRQYKVSIL